MSERKLQGLEPESVFRYFEEICAIPHGSRNTKAISDYLVSFAKAHGLRYRQAPAAWKTTRASFCRATWIWSAKRMPAAPWIWLRMVWT